ncbi:ABC transporter substrate-binding protein [Dactylosporangium sp. CA-092794]|uniref:ABC transporter substrate-binding protein n=1 Tax=Dactylosporangium sp. CA-092794 TaxID=3239929 RepID=UPI003D8EFED0
MKRGIARRALAALSVAVLLTPLGACKGGDDGGGKSSGGLTKVTVIESLLSLGYVPLYLGISHGFFKNHGLDVNLIDATGGSTAGTALLSGDAQFAGISITNAVASAGQGKPLVAFAEMQAQISVPVVVSTKLWQSSGLTDSSPLEDKIKLLRGKQLGVISPTGQNAQVFNYLFKAHNIDPGGAQQNVLKTPAAMVSALQHGQVDALNVAPPYPQQMVDGGFGHILINLTKGEDPTINGADSDGIVTTPQYIKDHPDLVQAFYDAMVDSDVYLIDHPTEAADEVYKKYFSQTDRKSFDEGFQAQIDGGVWSKDPAMTQQGMERLIGFLKGAGVEVPNNWNDAWTDKFSKAHS